MQHDIRGEKKFMLLFCQRQHFGRVLKLLLPAENLREYVLWFCFSITLLAGGGIPLCRPH
jgi:hypothetical protein